jgi:hypothetical protein
MKGHRSAYIVELVETPGRRTSEARASMKIQIRGTSNGDRGWSEHDECDADGAALKAFTASIPKDFAAGQKQILTSLFLCTEGQDQPVKEPHAELAAIAGLELSAYFTGLLKEGLIKSFFREKS